MAVPWNAYPATDGWVLICTASDGQWQKLAAKIDPTLAANVEFTTLAARVAKRAEIDALVAGWTALHPLGTVVEEMAACGIPCGPIVTTDWLSDEPNIALRGTIVEVHDPVTRQSSRVPGSLFHVDDSTPLDPVVGQPDGGRAFARALSSRRRQSGAATNARAAFAGLRVVEIGQYTTAPMVARHLATFGADVIKVEPPNGDSARVWAPQRNGTGHFFVMTNGEKRSLALDLHNAADFETFTHLIASADVLVENMKPGSLERLGFGIRRLRDLNPKLVYCGISGFGMRSVYEGRPAFDTIVQAMSGMMDATRYDDVPLKSGISAADIGGAQVALLAIVAALERRKRVGCGSMIDIAMQDVGAWLTQTQWNVTAKAASTPDYVASIANVCADPQTHARELIVVRCDASGTAWELLGSPLRLMGTPPRIGMPLGVPVRGTMGWRDDHPIENQLQNE
jgi:crotonobetainyl-CoA:carnitine CoA-transferase CaiB-like acyl-CoA transferase